MTPLAPPTIVRADNDTLFDDRGGQYIDLFSANGTAWLGHSNPGIAAAIAEQLTRVWTTGTLTTPTRTEAIGLLESILPTSHRVAGLCSTGMEAAEFAIRIARVATGRPGVIGFENSMHGKSLATSCLGWPSPLVSPPEHFARLPFSPTAEWQVLERVERILATGKISAVFVEPIQMSGSGHIVSPTFCQELFRLTAASGSLLIFDEILTGLHRTGPLFFFSTLGHVPDVILLGKALGNGFPVSAVVAHQRIRIVKEMLPGSTFAGNSLAAAAVTATLKHLRTLDIATRVATIADTVTRLLRPLSDFGVAARGRGAAWVIELPPSIQLDATVARIYERGVAVGYAGRRIRLLPAATIDPARLDHACRILAHSLIDSLTSATS